MFGFFTSSDRQQMRDIQHAVGQILTKLIKLDKLEPFIMTTTEAFEKIAQSDAQLKKGLAEVRTKIDEQTALIEQLRSTTLTPEQETLVNNLAASTQALDDIVPDAPTT